MEMWGRWCQFDDDSAFRVRVPDIPWEGKSREPNDLELPGVELVDCTLSQSVTIEAARPILNGYQRRVI